jgi:hypothetical protein
MTQLSIQDVNSAIMFGSFTNEQLESIIAAVKFRRSEISKSVKRSVAKGGTVRFYNNRLGRDMICVVEKVAIKYVTVREQGLSLGGLWRVPANMLTVVE